MVGILKDDLIKAGLLSNFFYSIAFPGIQKILISNVSQRYIAINSIIICIGTILLGKVWKEYGDKLYKCWDKMILAESIFYTLLVISMLTNLISYKFFYIVDTLLFAFLTKNIIFGGNQRRS